MGQLERVLIWRGSIRCRCALSRIKTHHELLLSHFELFLSAHRIKFVHQVFDPIKAHLLIKFIHHLVVFCRQVSVAISEIVEYVSEVCSVSVDEIASVCIANHIVPSREHHSQHGTLISPQRIYWRLKVLATHRKSNYSRKATAVFFVRSCRRLYPGLLFSCGLGLGSRYLEWLGEAALRWLKVGSH